VYRCRQDARGGPITSRLRFVSRQRRASAALITAIIAAIVAAAPGQAGAATQIGETFTPSGSPCGSDRIWLQTFPQGVPYAAPFAGVLTSWSYRAAASDVPQLKFKVARPAGGNDFTIVGEEGPHLPIAGMLNTYPARIPVRGGDVIGLYVGIPSGLCGRLVSGWGFHRKDGDTPPGTTATFSSFPTADFQLDVSATLEPDCDSDGFGDETQDPDPTGPNCPQTAPQQAGRTITLDANKNKVKKGKKVTLSGQVNEIVRQGPCESGQTVQLQRKKPSQATFATIEQVQTTATGNFSAKEKVKKTYEYRAQVPETAVCNSQVSNTEKVKVKKKK
jgi:hypothetical protein